MLKINEFWKIRFFETFAFYYVYVIFMNLDGVVLNSDKSDDEFIGVNEYSDENEAYSDDDI